MAKKRVILNQKAPHLPSGYIVNVYGHSFIVQKDGTLAATLEEEFIKSELKAGRYILAQGKHATNKEASNKPIATHLMDQFTYEIGNYYGAGSLKKLQEKIGVMRKAEINLFAETRLGHEFPGRMGKDKMVHELMTMIDTKYQHEAMTAEPPPIKLPPDEIIVEDIEEEKKEEPEVKVEEKPASVKLKKEDIDELEMLAEKAGAEKTDEGE